MSFKLFQWIQLFSLITALFCFKALKQFRLAAFIPLLVIVCVIEFIAGNYLLWGWKNNYTIYNYYFVISTPFLLYLLYNMLLFKGYLRHIYIIVCACLMVFVVYNTFFLQGIHIINTYSYLAVESVMVIFSFLVIARLFFEDDTTILLNQHPYFWINASTVLFGIGTLFIMGLSGYIMAKKIQIDGKNIYGYVTQGLNYILYLSYSYAFILCRKLTTN